MWVTPFMTALTDQQTAALFIESMKAKMAAMALKKQEKLATEGVSKPTEALDLHEDAVSAPLIEFDIDFDNVEED